MVLLRDNQGRDQAVSRPPAANGLPLAHGGGMGIRLPGRDDEQPVLWLFGETARALRLVSSEQQRAYLAGGSEASQRPGLVRHARQRVDVVPAPRLPLSERASRG